jgi:hydroxymethylpyrimidine pyrophosphatase-like HAD family hydrolase
VDSDPTARLRGAQPVWEVASAEVARAYGRFWPVARLAFADRMARTVLQTAHPSVVDGDMRPITWYTDPRSGRAVKTSFAARTFSNFDLVCFDDRFDVVGAAVHTDDAQYSRDLRTGYESHSGRTISYERWLLYELVHLWDLERLGIAAPEAVSNRKSRAIRRYLAEVLLADVAEVAHGPVVALDVDGVLETDLLGFKAPTPAAVLCLRALAVHGYRTVLATGRCLDDVVELSELFGLAGGIAEYGSVVYDRHAASTTPLVDGIVLEALARLRQRLLSDASVHVDLRHRFSVRASTLVGRQELHTYVPPPSIVPRELKAISGEGQTDFIGAHIDKAHGGRELLRGLHEQAPVLAVGDTVADVGLLSWATHSVVPKHADTPAKAAADRVARSPYQAGLAAAVSSLIGHRPGGCGRCTGPEMTDDTRAMLRLLRVSEGSRAQALLRSVPLAWAELAGRR